jgi:DNA-binding LacI/PurR family transcriptional regulator
MKPATIKDIAQVLDIHHSTVSRALKDHPDISEKTQKLVIETAKELNYTPNMAAASLRSGAVPGLLVSLPLDATHFIPGLLDEITAKAMTICQDSPTVVFDNTVLPGAYDKRLVVSFDEENDREKILSMAALGGKTVVVHFDLRKQMEMAIEGLCRAGKRQLGLISSHTLIDSRERAFNGILLDRFLPARSKNVLRVNDRKSEGEGAIIDAFAGFDSPDGIVATSAACAIRLASILESHQREATIVCLENDPLIDRLSPAISTIAFQIESVIDDAFRWLVRDDGDGEAHWLNAGISGD